MEFLTTVARARIRYCGNHANTMPLISREVRASKQTSIERAPRMWFKIDDKRSSTGQTYVIRCTSEVAGQSVTEERTAKGAPAARKAAELLAATLNTTATVYGRDEAGEFVYGVEEVAEGAASSNDPLIKRLYAETAAASLHFRDQLMADIPSANPIFFNGIKCLDSC
jgi:hypothetical protein